MNLPRLVHISLFTFCFTAISFAQTAVKPTFEVISVRPVPQQNLADQIRSGKMPGIMAVDGVRVDFSLVTLNGLLATAYNIKPSQIVGPDWLKSLTFEIHATIPKSSSKDQVPEMLQNLLADRFKLLAHRENREQPVYALVVSKGGLKLKKAVDDFPNTPEDSGSIIKRGEGRLDATMSGTPKGKVHLSISIGENGMVHEEISKATMADLAGVLTPMMDRPVVDMTDLKGSYQLTLEIPMQALKHLSRSIGAPDPGVDAVAGSLGATAGSAAGTGEFSDLTASDPYGGGIFYAVKQLGLQLDSRKVPVDTLVIDHIEKNPTEN
jgi:uncharacterized protein (TIGR03435 family)